jgi:hypothetical protein
MTVGGWPTRERVGHPAAWVGPRASFGVAPLRSAESGTYRNLKDGPPAFSTRRPSVCKARIARDC